MISRALIKPDRGVFYCWHRDCWQGFGKFRHCVRSGCRHMQVAPQLIWKQNYLGGILVPLGRRA